MELAALWTSCGEKSLKNEIAWQRIESERIERGLNSNGTKFMSERLGRKFHLQVFILDNVVLPLKTYRLLNIGALNSLIFTKIQFTDL